MREKKLTVDGVDRGLRLEADFDRVEGVPDERDGDTACRGEFWSFEKEWGKG